MTEETTQIHTEDGNVLLTQTAGETHAETSVPHETEAAPTGLASLGINLPLFVAQLVNVAIILVVLRIWVFKPLAKVLEDRRKKIEDGLKHAKEADDKLKHATEKEDAIVSAARKEAKQLVEEGRTAGEKVRSEQVAEAKRDIDAQTEDAKAKIQTERASALEAVRKEVATLVMAATRKVSATELDEKAHRDAIEQAIKELESKT